MVINIVIFWSGISGIHRRVKEITYQIIKTRNCWELTLYGYAGEEIIETYGLQKVASGLKSINLSVDREGIEVYFRGEGDFYSPYDVSGYHALIGIKITSIDPEFHLDNYTHLILKIKKGNINLTPQNSRYFVSLFFPSEGGYYFTSPEKGGIVEIEVSAGGREIVIPVGQLIGGKKIPHQIILIIGVKQDKGVYSGSFILQSPIRFQTRKICSILFIGREQKLVYGREAM
jgi:hypothetical protein